MSEVLRLCIRPEFREGEEKGGGVQRVVEAQRKYMPALGFELVDDPRGADIIAMHATSWVPRASNPEAVRVVHNHGLYWADYDWGGRWAEQTNWSIIRSLIKADLVVAPSEWVANILRRDLWLEAPVLHNGIEAPRGRAAAAKSEGYVLWNKGRVNATCDPSAVVALAKQLVGTEFKTTFLPNEESPTPPNVGVTGVLPHADALAVLRKAGVYLATARDSFSVGVLEALSYGIPVLGWDWGGTPEVVRHQKEGWLATPGDLDSLVEGYQYIVSHYGDLSAMAKLRAGEFTWQATWERCAELYREAWSLSRLDGPKVSVVIPCYNLGKFLPAAVKSAIDQKVPGGHEIIIVDDSSTDGSAGVAAELAVAENVMPVRALQLPENLYLAEALNQGIRMAKGKYILNLDADNLLPEGSLAELARALDRDEDLDVAYGAMQVVTEQGTPDSTVGHNGYSRPAWPPAVFDYRALMSHKSQVHSSAMFRRRVWERVRGYRQHVAYRVKDSGAAESIRLNSDADFWTRAATLGFKFARVTNNPTLIYRRRKDSMSRVVPDYDWAKWSPNQKWGARVPMGVSNRPFTLEPIVVSVICYAGPETAGLAWRAAESVWRQTYDNWEFILEGDPDTALGGLPPFVRRGGVPRGEYVLRMQADEYLEPWALEALMVALGEAEAEEGEIPFVYSNYREIETGEVRPSSDVVMGAVLVPQDYLGPLNDSGLCAVWVDEPLLVRHSVPEAENAEDTILAGCSGCGGRARRPANLMGMRMKPGAAGNGSGGGLTGASAEIVAGDGEVLVTYKGTGMRTVVGPSGRRYRFGTDPSHRQRPVRAQDLIEFQRRPSIYEIVR